MWLLLQLHMCSNYYGIFFESGVSGDQSRHDSCMTGLITETKKR